ncbi:hypothetical protein [Stieleria magnilauensis]|uniref:hypothetical protein n=1 Tax=Stieleria magnilauensis TaxID=2527963 RepID=UPI003AF44FA7
MASSRSTLKTPTADQLSYAGGIGVTPLPLDGDVENKRCDDVGFVTTELLRRWTPFADAEFYFCGPKEELQPA